MYAVIETGGKQYRVSQGDLIQIERLEGEIGESIEFPTVLFVGGDNATQSESPSVEGVRVMGTIVDQPKGKKVIVFKFKRRKMYRRKTGHRQLLTSIRIEEVQTPQLGSHPQAEKKEAPPKKEPRVSAKASEAAEQPAKPAPKPKSAVKEQEAAPAAASPKPAAEKPTKDKGKTRSESADDETAAAAKPAKEATPKKESKTTAGAKEDAPESGGEEKKSAAGKPAARAEDEGTEAASPKKSADADEGKK